MKNADPADAQALGPGRQPQVLDGADRAEQIHDRLGGPADDDRPEPAPVAGHADVDRRLTDALQLQLAVHRLLFRSELHRRLLGGALEILADLLFDGNVADENEVPRLHETD